MDTVLAHNESRGQKFRDIHCTQVGVELESHRLIARGLKAEHEKRSAQGGQLQSQRRRTAARARAAQPASSEVQTASWLTASQLQRAMSEEVRPDLAAVLEQKEAAAQLSAAQLQGERQLAVREERAQRRAAPPAATTARLYPVMRHAQSAAIEERAADTSMMLAGGRAATLHATSPRRPHSARPDFVRSRRQPFDGHAALAARLEAQKAELRENQPRHVISSNLALALPRAPRCIVCGANVVTGSCA